MQSFSTQNGGVALEYLLVSIFAMGVTLILLGTVAKISEERFQKIAEQLDIDLGELDFDLLNSE